jgi:phosphohistidine swiveling domain-containing protein
VQGENRDKLSRALELSLNMNPLTPDHHYFVDQGTNARLRIAVIAIGRDRVPYGGLWDLPDRFYAGEPATNGEIKGLAASPGVVEGNARFVSSLEEFDQVQEGDILVCRMTNPAWVVLLTKIKGLVTEAGGAASHPAVVAREFGIRAVVGTANAGDRIKTGERIPGQRRDRGRGAARSGFVMSVVLPFAAERALCYRSQKGSLSIAVVVQRIVHADISGVLFTCDPVRKRRDRMVVDLVIGLGEAAVSGAVTPDQYILKRDGRVRRCIPMPATSCEPRTWVGTLDPGAGERLRLAAVLHDIERAFPDPDAGWDSARPLGQQHVQPLAPGPLCGHRLAVAAGPSRARGAGGGRRAADPRARGGGLA